ncbi:MAG: class I SAM-dependent methyltransferase, partial [Spirochaetales bacterium]|nr:class I SAM-dependent methyltransferase [Spirochaetales bacterium]
MDLFSTELHRGNLWAMSEGPTWNAEKYAGISQQQMQWALQTLGSASVAGDEDILDVGCGDGKITAAIAKITTGSVIGIDRSREMIVYATRHHRTSERDNLSFRVGHAESFFPEKLVDVITSFTALHWVSDHNHLLRHFTSILSERGTLALQFPGR